MKLPTRKWEEPFFEERIIDLLKRYRSTPVVLTLPSQIFLEEHIATQP